MIMQEYKMHQLILPFDTNTIPRLASAKPWYKILLSFKMLLTSLTSPLAISLLKNDFVHTLQFNCSWINYDWINKALFSWSKNTQFFL